MATKPKMNGKEVKISGQSVGLVQWFHPNSYAEVEQALADIQKLGITHLRTNVSWAYWHQGEGQKWYDWLFQTLGSKVKLLPCIFHTPPSLGIKPNTTAPLKDPKDFAQFIDRIITDYGQYFDYIELWNEPNNLAEYNYTLDPDWNRFSQMISAAASQCQQRGKKAVLGGMNPIDPTWLRQLFVNNAMQHIDVVGIQGFPDVYSNNWESWNAEIEKIQEVLNEHQSTAKIWIAETGFSTWQKRERQQLKAFLNILDADVSRVYWNGLMDAAQQLENNLDEKRGHFGMKNADGSPKLLYTLLSSVDDVRDLKKYEWMTGTVAGKLSGEKYTLITGGAGFVGVNLADRILSEGKHVMVFDNLSRAGVQKNLFWLKDKYPDRLQILIGDIRDKEAVKRAVQGADQIFHFAAQVAVTSSLVNPYHDFEVNALGTLNVLEAVRHTAHQPPIVFTSTNKVYGDLEDIGMVMTGTRYQPEDSYFRQNGISEARSLDFHSPYGCTKGVADQYILDYSRTFGLKTVVFRMSCIYGPHQFGTEDQGWVAHFLIQALKGKPITLYGDGKQVRDILFVEDLVNAFLLAQENMYAISGNAFNMGGGVNNTVSLLELIDLIEDVSGIKPEVSFDDWRPSDQKYYVSDFSKFKRVTGWSPKYGTREGVIALYEWLLEHGDVPVRKKAIAKTTIKNLEPVDK